MKSGVFCGYLIGVFLFSQHAAKAQTTPILWNDTAQVMWVDFKGAPVLSDSFLAVTATSISYSSRTDGRGNLSFTVKNSFTPEKSWAKKDRNLTDALLAHERLHFALSEAYARKIRMAFAEYQSNHAKPKVEDLGAIFKRFSDELNRQQDLYDRETDHSKNVVAQSQWSERITRMLQEYAAFR